MDLIRHLKEIDERIEELEMEIRQWQAMRQSALAVLRQQRRTGALGGTVESTEGEGEETVDVKPTVGKNGESGLVLDRRGRKNPWFDPKLRPRLLGNLVKARAAAAKQRRAAMRAGRRK